MLGSELRKRYLDFFVGKGAKLIASDSLVPNDPTLMFTSAGMVQFKPVFLGEVAPQAPRATTVQKCLRTTDIEEVGDTSHCTFFEMLGNFSFGDYFKPEAVAWAWEFLFDVLGLDLKRVRVTIFTDDDEAFELWRQAGMPENKIFRFGEKSNYWPASAISEGPNGPCGPCSEIFYDTQPDLPPTPDGVWDDNRWLEIWNLVFMQFERGDGGTLTPLPKRNIDTGMGLERTAAVLNDLRGPFETDLFAPILSRLQELSGKSYGSHDLDKTDIAFRRVADHVRATTFAIADGVLPSNVGRGYVLRRIMRRAVLAGRNALGFDKDLLVRIIPTVIEQYGVHYPDLAAKRDTILRYAAMEENQFRRTLAEGSQRLEHLLTSKQSGDALSGDDAFELFATYGFPLEMTVELAGEHGLTVERNRYDERIAEHAEISSRGHVREVMGGSAVIARMRETGATETIFTGYAELETEARVVAIVADGELAGEAAEGASVRIALDRTPFYAEAGGQVGDTGWIRAEAADLTVLDTQKESGYTFHAVEVTAGVIRVGDVVTATVDRDRRLGIMRNHSATHLLHKALQTTLGSHVQQRGSLVAPDRLRFDFSHDRGLTPAQIREIEAIVNEEILTDLPVETLEKPIDDARQMGAMMLFGEKYGSVVRVVKMGDYSLEFCGGTHLAHTSQAGLFKILSEGSSQAGVRRIEATTGRHALLKLLDQERILQEAASALKVPATALVAGVEKLQAELRATEKELGALSQAAAGSLAEKLAAEAKTLPGGIKLVAAAAGEMDADALRALADEVLDRMKGGVVVLASTSAAKVALAVKAGKDAVAAGAHAGNLVKLAAQAVGGGGGGRPDFAQAGGRDASKIPDALAAAEAAVQAL